MTARSSNPTPGSAPLPTWDGPEYVRVPPGPYDAVVTRHQGPEWVRRFRRWSLMVEFELLSESKRVCAFFNMGSNPERPRAGPQSRYFLAWTLANGERPRPKQKLDPSVFLDGQIFKVEVEDSQADADGQQKDESLIYSRVRAVLSAALPNHHNQPIRQSSLSPDFMNQESKIMQSRSQESTNQGGKGWVRVSPQPGDGNAHAKQTRRAGVSAPAQASSANKRPTCGQARVAESE